jgi:hypothetical protein
MTTATATTTPPEIFMPAGAWVRIGKGRWKRIHGPATPPECKAVLDKWKAENTAKSFDSFIGGGDPNTKRRI